MPEGTPVGIVTAIGIVSVVLIVLGIFVVLAAFNEDAIRIWTKMDLWIGHPPTAMRRKDWARRALIGIGFVIIFVRFVLLLG